MALAKCPRCELNYILDGDSLCTVCRREVRGEVTESDDIPELCSECGESPVVLGSELCLSCLKEMSRRVSSTVGDDAIAVVEDPNLEIDSVSAMDEIEIDIDGGLEDEVFEEDEEVFGDDQDEESLDEIDDEIDDDDLLDR